MDDRPRYMISVAAELVGMHPQTLRIYEAKGLVRPEAHRPGTRASTRSATSSGCALIQRLTTELGLNLAGVERVLALEDELQRLRRRVDRLERQLREEVERRCTGSTAATSSSDRRPRQERRGTEEGPLDGLQQS